MPKLATRVLPAKDKSIAAAAFAGTGRETEFRVDGIPGLVLAVMPQTAAGTTRRVWRVYYSATISGRRTIRKVRLGAYPQVGLAEARRKAAEIMDGVERGRDLIGEQLKTKNSQAQAELTFSNLIDDYIVDLQSEAVKTVAEVRRALVREALPSLGNKHPTNITPVDIERVVDAVKARGSLAMARHLLSYLRGAFNHGLDSAQLRNKYGLIDNPAERVGRARRGKSSGRYGKAKPKERVLDDNEIAAFWSALNDSEIDHRTRWVLKLILLTGQRSGEVRGLQIGELSLDDNQPFWHLPGIRTKNGRENIVPLAPLAIAIIREALNVSHGNQLFASHLARAGVITRFGPARALARLRKSGRLEINAFTPHDLRRTAATGMRRLGVAPEVVSMILNHTRQDVTAKHYDHHDGFLEKLAALTTWAAHVEALVIR